MTATASSEALTESGVQASSAPSAEFGVAARPERV